MKVANRVLLIDEERTMLNLWLRLPMSARLVLRAKIILLAADGRTNQEIARQLQASRKTVSLWRRRFLKDRLAGIAKESPRGRQGPMVDEAVVRLILQKMKERPVNTPRWTIRSLANWGFHRPGCIACGKPATWILVKSNSRSGIFSFCAVTFPDSAIAWASDIPA